MGKFILDGTAQIDALTSIFLVVGIAIIVPYIAARGFFQKKAREFIIRATEFARDEKYSEAQHSIVVATRLNSALKKNSDVRVLVQIIRKQSSPTCFGELRRVAIASGKWPKSRWEIIFDNRWFRMLVVILIFAAFIAKFLPP